MRCATSRRRRSPPLEVRLADDGERSRDRNAAGPATAGVAPSLRVRRGTAGAGAQRSRARARAATCWRSSTTTTAGARDHLAGLRARVRGSRRRNSPGATREVVRERVARGRTCARCSRAVEIARDWDPALMRINDYLPPSAWAVRRSLFERLGGFDDAFRFSEDWDFLLRAAALHARRAACPGSRSRCGCASPAMPRPISGPSDWTACGRLAARHGLPPLEPRTFWEVAHAWAKAAVTPDLLVVGAGPAGVSAALWARALELEVLLLDGAARAGRAAARGALPPDRRARIRARRRRRRSRTPTPGSWPPRACRFARRRGRGTRAARSVRASARVVRLESGERLEAAAVLVASGRPPSPARGAGRARARGTRRLVFRRRAIASASRAGASWWWVAATRAFENALLLAGAGCDVTLLVRGRRGRAPSSGSRVAAEPRIRCAQGTRVIAIVLGEDAPCAASAWTARAGRPRSPPTASCQGGRDPQQRVVPRTRSRSDADGYVRVDAQLATSAPRVWAAGDVTRPVPPSIPVALGQGAQAAAMIRAALRGALTPGSHAPQARGREGPKTSATSVAARSPCHRRASTPGGSRCRSLPHPHPSHVDAPRRHRRLRSAAVPIAVLLDGWRESARRWLRRRSSGSTSRPG